MIFSRKTAFGFLGHLLPKDKSISGTAAAVAFQVVLIVNLFCFIHVQERWIASRHENVLGLPFGASLQHRLLRTARVWW